MNRHPAPLRLPRVRTLLPAAGCILAALFLTLAAVPAVPINLNLTTGDWTVTVPPADLPTVPGTDISVSTFTSAANQVVFDIRRNPGGWMTGGTGWIVTVHRGAPETWHANLHLFIRRTSADANLVGPLNVYQEVTGTDQEMYRCNTQTAVQNIAHQLEIRGVSAVIGQVNSTTVYYTVTEF